MPQMQEPALDSQDMEETEEALNNLSEEVVAEAPAESESGNVTLDFRDADFRNVLKILSYKSGVNIVAGPEVTGLITIKLQEVPWQKAL